MDINKIIKHPIKVLDVKYNDDSFLAKLEDGQTIDISLTHWNTSEFREVVDGGIVLSNEDGNIILLSNDQIKEIETY